MNSFIKSMNSHEYNATYHSVSNISLASRLGNQISQIFLISWGTSPFPSTWWEHQVEVVSHILIEICDKVVVVAKVQVNLVVVVIVCVDVVVDIDDQGDDSGNKAHVAESIGSTSNSITSQIFAFFLLLLELVDSL